jgi:hypothetical protein
MGAFVEVHGAFEPSLSFTATDTNPTGTGPSGVGKSIGVNLGVEFDVRRSGRFAFGMGPETTSLDGGSVSAVPFDVRYDLKLAALDDAALIQLGLGASGGTATGSDSTGMNRKTVEGSLFAGAVFAKYLGQRVVLRAMVGPEYYLAGVPGGSVAGPGIMAKLALSYTFDDNRRAAFNDWVFARDSYTVLITRLIAGAERNGCEVRSAPTAATIRINGELGTAVAEAHADEVRFRCPSIDPSAAGESVDVKFINTDLEMIVNCVHTTKTWCGRLREKIYRDGGIDPDTGNLIH